MLLRARSKFFLFSLCFWGQVAKTEDVATNANVFTEEMRVSERQQILDLIANPRAEVVELKNIEALDARGVAFVLYYKQFIHPTGEKMGQLGAESALLQVARDTALFNDEKEKEAWNQRLVDIGNEMQAISADPAYQARIKKWAELATGLSGELAEAARRSWRMIERFEFSEAELPLTERLNELTTKVDDAFNSSPVVKGLSANSDAQAAVWSQYFSGALSFKDAAAKVNTLVKGSKVEHGQDFSTTATEALNESAVLRTRLAQKKGFAHQAAFILAKEEHQYEEQFKTPEGRIQFLEKFLKDTDAAYRAFLTERLSVLEGVTLADLRPEHLDNLVEADSIVKDFFPVEKVEGLWKETMCKAGFDKAVVDGVKLDCFPRENKYTHAYMMPALSHSARVVTIDGSLGVDIDDQAANAANWNPAGIYIVQNFMSDGRDSIEVALHEGGHAMDYSHQKDSIGYGNTSSYAEVHSIFMEHIQEDHDFLKEMRSRDGRQLSDAEIEKFQRNAKVSKLIRMREIAYRSLLDLKLWSYDFAAPGAELFTDRARRIYGEEYEKGMLIKGENVDGIDWRNAVFMRPHFYGGWVMYFGYLAADLGAEQVASYLLDTFEKETGRRSLYAQPTMAEKLIKGLYESGFKLPFPEPLEKFTGRQYSVANSTQPFIDAALAFKADPEKVVAGGGVCEAATGQP